MNNTLQNIIDKYEVHIIENALVKLFIEENNLPVKNNTLIKNILSDSSDSVNLAKKELQKALHSQDIFDFVNVFELLVPKEDKKLNGAFYTPRTITDYMVKETITKSGDTICDPSCGCGAFLISAAEHISSKFNTSIVNVIENQLFGVDIADYGVKRAEILLSLLALSKYEDVKDIKFNLIISDSLSSNWQDLFNIQFDVIIGNPPYVKFQDLPLELRKSLNTDWKTLNTGNYNLYFAFFELGVDLIKEGGVLIYITPNNYFTSLAGVPLRQYLELNRLIEKVLDFNHLRLFAAQTYTCITKLNKQKKDEFSFERVDEASALKDLHNLKYSTISFTDLNNKKWRLLRQKDQQNIRKIEKIGNKLGSIVDIRVGIATCKDSVYFIDGNTRKGKFYSKTYNGKEYKIEEAVTKPIAKISDFKNQAELDDNVRRIIFPYQKRSGKVEIIPEAQFKKQYPNCYKYLLEAKDELKTRDKGRVEYPEWYAYARTQGLNSFGQKLFTPTFSAEPRFLFEKYEDTLFCNGYAIYLINSDNLFTNTKSELDLSVLSKILNSSVMDYYIKQTSVSIEGGYPCYQKNFIELFGIPKFSEVDIKFLKRTTKKEDINNFLEKKYDIKI